MADRLPSFYAVGTATVEQGGTVVTGQDTLWAGKIWPGDRFGTHLGFGIRVLSVDSNEQLTLAYPCPFAQTAAAYEIGITPDTARMQETTRLLMTKLRNGNLEAFSDIAGNIDMVPVFTGPGAMDAVPLSELTRGIDVDAKVATLAERDAFDDRAAGFSVLVNNIGDGRAAIYTKASAAVGDWSVPAVITGPQGALTPFEFVAPEELAPGSTPTVSNTGTPTAPKMKFGIPAGRGFYSKGNYAAGTTYQTDDVVLFNGSSWIALQETTGNAPPALPASENAWWRLIAKKGNDGLGTVTELVAGSRISIDSTDPTKPVVGLADIATARILGRAASGTGPVDVLTGTQARAVIAAQQDLQAVPSIELGAAVTGDRSSYVDFHATDDASQADYSARFHRSAGPDGALSIIQRGTGDIRLDGGASLTRDGRLVFDRGNILGEVAQAGGIPTGALIEYGSNANGSYARWADGTQFCWVSNSTSSQTIDVAYGSVFIGSRTWNYPAEFASRPTVAAPGVNWGNGASWGSVTTFPGNSSVTMRIHDGFSRAAGTTFVFNFFAAGRWY